MKTALIVVLTAAVACGGAPKPDATEPLETARGGQRHEVGHLGQVGGGSTEADEEARMPPAVATFHATLAPRWHAAQGPQRMTDTCAAISEFHGEADAIAAAAPPDGSDAAAWSAGGKQLVAAVAALDHACKAGDGAAFETAFAQVHERFHGLVATVSGEHDHDAGHGDAGHGEPHH